MLDRLAIKGGTAIRKLYAGNEGRFSLDLDFALADFGCDREETELLLLEIVDGLYLESFGFKVNERRGKLMIVIESPFVPQSTLATKLDLSAPSWLKPTVARWSSMPIHDRYPFRLPEIGTVRLEENIAEKIARLNRTTAARDMYDLAWLSRQSRLWQGLDKALIRRLALLKIWVDAHGMSTEFVRWEPAHEGLPFDPERWLRVRSASEFDAQDIGALAVPTPSPEELSETVSVNYAFLADLNDDERTLAGISARDRGVAIRLMKSLPGQRLSGMGLY